MRTSRVTVHSSRFRNPPVRGGCAARLNSRAMLKAIIFDFDGVLVDSEPTHYAAFQDVGKTLGVTFDYDEYLRTYIGFDDRDAFREMLARAGQSADPQRIAELCAQKQDAFDRMARASTTPIPGAMALLDAASDAMPIAIASGATRRDIDLMLTGLGRTNKVHTIVAADDVHKSKPDPETYRLAAEQLAARHPGMHLQPGQCLAIEDTAAGLAAARGAGLLTLGITTTSSRNALRDAHRVVDGLEGVTLQTLHGWYG